MARASSGHAPQVPWLWPLWPCTGKVITRTYFRGCFGWRQPGPKTEMGFLWVWGSAVSSPSGVWGEAGPKLI